jgi:hypothetical protein
LGDEAGNVSQWINVYLALLVLLWLPLVLYWWVLYMNQRVSREEITGLRERTFSFIQRRESQSPPWRPIARSLENTNDEPKIPTIALMRASETRTSVDDLQEFNVYPHAQDEASGLETQIQSVPE